MNNLKVEKNINKVEMDISNLTLKELKDFCRKNKIRGFSKYKKKELIDFIKKELEKRDIDDLVNDLSKMTVKKIKKIKKMMNNLHSIITITCGDVAENHIGNQQIGKLVEKGSGFDKKDLELASHKFNKLGYKTEMYLLNDGLDGVLIDEKQAVATEAYILIIRNGLEAIVGKNNVLDFFNKLVDLDWDKKYWDTRRKKVLNKNARHNLCFSENNQEPDYENGKGRIVSYNSVSFFEKIMKDLPEFFGDKAKNLQAEGNKYYNKNKTGIGYHGDTERRKVIAWRLGKGEYGDEKGSMSMHWQWYVNSKPVGKNMKFIINSGDIYVMSEKSTGQDWKKKKNPETKKLMPTLRHAAGCDKYTKIKNIEPSSIKQIKIKSPIEMKIEKYKTLMLDTQTKTDIKCLELEKKKKDINKQQKIQENYINDLKKDEEKYKKEKNDRLEQDIEYKVGLIQDQANDIIQLISEQKQYEKEINELEENIEMFQNIMYTIKKLQNKLVLKDIQHIKYLIQKVTDDNIRKELSDMYEKNRKKYEM